MIFFSPDDGGLGGDGDLQFEDAATPGLSLEVVDDEPAEIAGKDRMALLKEMQDKEAEFARQRTALEAQASQTAALQGAFSGLADRLEKVVSRPQGQMQPVYPQQPQETAEQFRDRIQQNLLLDPVGAISEVGERIYAPRIQQQAATIASLTEQLLMQNPEKKVIFDKYGPEIKALAATAPGNPNAIFEATEIVASRHMSDIIADQVTAKASAMFEEFKAQYGGQGAQGASAGARGGVHVETAAPKAPLRDAQGRRIVRVTSAQKAEIATRARAMNMTEEQYADLYVDTAWQKEF